MFTAVSLVFAAALVAQAPTTDREADMFGSDEPAGAPADVPAGEAPASDAPSADASSSRDDALFGGSSDTLTPGVLGAAVPSGIIDSADNALAIGGQLFLRLNGRFLESQDPADAAFTGPSLLDTFADVRPNDRLRAYAQLRFNFDYTVSAGETDVFGAPKQAFSLQLAQAWTKFDIGQVAYVTAGRQRIRWGTGRFWNPTDFVNQEVRNSFDFFDQRVGVDLVKVHFPLEQLGWNLYLISAFNGFDVLSDTGLAARAEFVFGPAELSLSSFVKKNAPLKFGADISAGIWLFDVKAEGVLSRGLNKTYYEGDYNGDFDGCRFNLEGAVCPTEVDTTDNWYFEGVLGVEAAFNYTDTATISVGAEYFYNQAGYTSASIYPWLLLNDIKASREGNLTHKTSFVGLYNGVHYGAVYASAQKPFDIPDLSVTVSTLANLSDLSAQSRLDVQYTLLQYLTVNAFVSGQYGNRGEFRLGFDIDAITGVLPNAIRVESPVSDVGLALRMAF
jgi:hypothetical protein